VNTYPVPAAPVAVEYESKKSRFIARAACAPDRAAALALLQQAKAQYPDARHHCWAYLLGNPASATSAAMSDDGEPAGTAGKPILNVLQHKGVGDIMLVVTRYFGGIKLGAGGLVRAYSAAAQLAMEQLVVQQRVAMVALQIGCGFAQEQTVRHWLSVCGGQVDNCHYGDGVQLLVAVPQAALQRLQALAADYHWQLRRADS
jgi:uncharacterized YigZ family protein